MKIRALLGAVVMLATVFAFAPAAEAAIVCPPNPAPGSTVSTAITVAGGICTLDNVTVTSSITVSSGAQLVIHGGTVGGSITVRPGAELIDEGAAVSGSITVTDGWAWIGAFRTAVPTVAGAITMNSIRDGAVCIVTLSGGFTLQNWTTFTPPPLAFPPCSVPPGSQPEQFSGNVTLVNNSVPGGIFFDQTVMKGALKATGNTSGVTLDHLQVGGSATCSNTPPATFTNSTVVGTNTCPG